MPESCDGYCFVVYPPATPGLPWLSVCFKPDGSVLDVEAFATHEEAEAVAQRGRAILEENFLQRPRPPNGVTLQ